MPTAYRFLDYRAAVLLAVASMVGTGVFTTLGIQAEGVPDGAALLLLWLLGGLVALCGALSYAELAAALPRSGGEYRFLGRIYHPVLGQLAGWVSVSVGFSAPVALASMALGRYLAAVLPVNALAVAVLALLGATGLHAFDVALGRTFQVVTTVLKVLILLFFSIAGLGWALAVGPAPGAVGVMPSADTLAAVWSLGFAQSLIYVSYAYSGWNAAAYVADEVRDPQRNVPRAMVTATLAVTGLYVLVNLTFLLTVDYGDLVGTLEVGVLSARGIFGPDGGWLLGLALSLLLVSSVSAMTLAGPRVLQAIGEDVRGLRFLARCNRRGAPTRAVLVQQGLALGLVLTDSFEAVLTFAGFTLTLFALLTVAGVLRLRHREPDLPRPFRVPLYPLPPLVFLTVSGVALLVVAWERPLALMAIALVAIGAWIVGRRRGERP